jgi:alpha-mannosidase
VPGNGQYHEDVFQRRVAEIRDVLGSVKFGFLAQRWRVVSDAAADKSVLQTSAGHFLGAEFTPGGTVRMRLRLKVPKQIAGIGLDGESLQCHVFSRFPFSLGCDGEEVIRCPDPPIVRGRVLTTVLPLLTPGAEHDLSLVVDVPPNLVAYGFRLAFSTPRLRERWHEADRAFARLLLAAEAGHAARQHIVAAMERRWDDLYLSDVGSLAGFLDSLLPTELPAAETLPLVHLVGHAHLDVEWLWTWQQSQRAALALCERAACLLEAYPQLRFTFSQAVVYEMISREQPELFDRIRGLVRAGRWEAATSTWLENDLTVPSAESVVRQFLAGDRFSQAAFGGRSDVYLAADAFGLPANLPGQLVRAGCRAVYHTRCHPLPEHGGPAYRWIGPDGSTVLGLVTDAYDGELLASRVAESAIAARRAGLRDALMLFDIDGHTGADVAEALERLRIHGATPGLPSTRFSTLSQFASEVGDQDLPVFRGVPPTIFEGTYSSLSVVKQALRQAEKDLLRAEVLSCLAGLVPAALEDSWRQLLFWQNHDTAAGSGTADVYARLTEELPRWRHTVDGIHDIAVEHLVAGTTADVTVVNPTPWPTRHWVTLPAAGEPPSAMVAAGDGVPLAVQQGEEGLGFLASVEPWSVTAYHRAAVTATAPREPALWCDEQASPEPFAGEENRKEFFTAGNRYFRMTVRGDAGAIVSLVMPGGRELVGYGLKRPTTFTNTARPDLAINVLQLVRERPHAMSAWHLHDVDLERSLLHTGETSWAERGPLRAVLRTRHDLGPTEIVQTLTIYRDLPRIDVVLTVDWHEPSGDEHGVPGLKVACTPDLIHPRVHAGSPGGVVEWPANGQERPMQRWIDVADDRHGVAMFADDRFGFDALGSRIRLTLVRDTYDPVVDAEKGAHVFRYSLLPHTGSWRDARLPVVAAELASEPSVWLGPGRAGRVQVRTPLPVLDGVGLLESVTWAESGTAVLCRIADWSGEGGICRLGGLPPGTACWSADPTGRATQQLPADDAGRPVLNLRPWEVATIVYAFEEPR